MKWWKTDSKTEVSANPDWFLLGPAAPRWRCVPRRRPCAAGFGPPWCERLCWRRLAAGRLRWSNDRAEQPGGAATSPAAGHTHNGTLITLVCSCFTCRLQLESHPVGGERSSVGHQVSDLIVLTFTSRFQQTLPEVHQRHLTERETFREAERHTLQTFSWLSRTFESAGVQGFNTFVFSSKF